MDIFPLMRSSVAYLERLEEAPEANLAYLIGTSALYSKPNLI